MRFLAILAISLLLIHNSIALDIDFIKNPFLDLIYCLEEKIGYGHKTEPKKA
jgi:hypothetical protein